MAVTKAPHPPRLFLLRHGNTDWSDSRKHTGRTDIPLNASGEQHALLLGKRLKGETFARIFVSPLIRVRRTCELAGFAEDAEVDPDLTEWDYGVTGRAKTGQRGALKTGRCFDDAYTSSLRFRATFS